MERSRHARQSHVHPLWRHRRATRRCLLIGFAAACMFVALRTRPRRHVVEGLSMAPTLLPGDRLLVVRTPRVRPGEVVVFRDPREPRRVVVKRVGSLSNDLVEVRGDNEAESTDSRHFGPLRESDVVGRVVRRYWPPARAGRL